MRELSGRVLAAVIGGIVLVVGGLLALLWLTVDTGGTLPERAQSQLELVRIGLTIALGGGGLFGLYLAWRRQRSTEIGLAQKQQDQIDVARAYELQRETFETTRLHQERVAAATERDAEARRITDLYTKAVEQLGSDKAPVRLGGLYALERLAQDHVEQRQTIVNVLCAYLRMPFTPPNDAEEEMEPERVDAHQDRVQEREVRLAAQRLLATHVHPGEDRANPVSTFWTDIDLDLSGATLMAFDLSDCVVRTAGFVNTTFTHTARFRAARFTGDATFDNASFTYPVQFDSVTFAGKANFKAATFAGRCKFRAAVFIGDADFYAASFADGAQFTGARFTAGAYFQTATFTRTTEFTGVTFSGQTLFSEAKFDSLASFLTTTFVDGAVFQLCEFNGNAIFSKATITRGVSFQRAKFNDAADFDNAIFDLQRRPGSSVHPWLILDEAHFERGVPPELEQVT